MSEVELSRSEIQTLIDEWVFDEKARKILARRWFDGVTYEKLAAEFGLSTRQTVNIVRKARNEVFKHFPKITI